jgi:hypothetical protein
MKVEIEITESDAALIELFLESTKSSEFNTHGPLDIKRCAEMLMEDVALMVRRPGSWEGANMAQVMVSHGYSL